MKMSITDSVRRVLALKDLSPGPIVNEVFGQLVDSIIESSDYESISLISPSDRHRVRTMAADAESKLEDFWAKQIINSKDPNSMLSAFPYAVNYKQLVQKELMILRESGFQLNEAQSVLVIGSGSLPLTAIEIKHQTGATVHCVDSSREAIQLCENVCTVLGIKSKVFLSSGEHVTPNWQYNLILIAALAGSDLEQKQHIVINVIRFLATGGRIVLRGAHGVRALLYPAFNASELLGVTLIKEYHPSDSIINSVFVYKSEGH